MKNLKRYCSHPCIDLRGLFKRRSLNWEAEIRSQRKIFYTYQGRIGIGRLCKILEFKSDDEILMPAYNCGTEIDPFLHYGLNVVFYRVDKSTKIDFENLVQQVTSKTRAIYVTHYFGWPQDCAKIIDYCRKENIYLIEDCALSLFSKTNGHSIGLVGNAAIYSFPKTLAVPDGGALTILSNSHLDDSLIISPEFGETTRRMLPFIKRAVLRLANKFVFFPYLPGLLIGFNTRLSKPIPLTNEGLYEIPKEYYYNPRKLYVSASSITRYIVNHTDSQQVIAQRRQNYLQLLKGLVGCGLVTPLYGNLPEGVCPLFFPVIVEDRETLCNTLNKRGIAGIQWWSGFHRNFSWKDFPEAQYLKEHLLALPIHQQLTSKDIDYMINEIQVISSEN